MPNTRGSSGSRAGRVRERLQRRSLTIRALAIGCLLPVPMAFAAPPALVETLGATSRELFSPPHEVEGPLGHLAGDPSRADTADTARDTVDTATDTGVVTVPSSKTRVRAVSLAGDHDIPAAALRAYREAAATLGRTDPACDIDWALLAGIGRVESDHGRYAGTTVHVDGTTSPHILGLPLDGSPGVAAISDSDGGRLDGDTVWDRAVGPMQFIPTTWSMVAADGDGDGVRDPHDLDDAALAAGVYLCAGDGDLSSRSDAAEAVFRYNHSDEYVALVLSLATAYRSGVVALPSTPVDGDGSAPDLERPPDGPAGGEQQDTTRVRHSDTDRKTAEQRPADQRSREHQSPADRSPKSPDGRRPTDRGASPTPDTDVDRVPGGDGRQQPKPDDGETQPPDGDKPPVDGPAPPGEDGPAPPGEDEPPPPGEDEPRPPGEEAPAPPETVRIVGAIAACDDSLCVTEAAEAGGDATTWTLDLTDVGDDTSAADFDQDTSMESVHDELTGVADQNGTVTLDVHELAADGVATLVQVIGAELPESEDGPDGSAEPQQLTGRLAATDSPRVWTFLESAPEQRTWTIDLSEVPVSTTDPDQDGTTLDRELAALSEQPKTTLTVAKADHIRVLAIDELELGPLDITATPQASDQ